MIHTSPASAITEAQARLIAAAPDLLEACIFALENGDEYAALKKMKAAVAKAAL